MYIRHIVQTNATFHKSQLLYLSYFDVRIEEVLLVVKNFLLYFWSFVMINQPITVLNSKGIQSFYIFCLSRSHHSMQSLYISCAVGNQQLNKFFLPIFKFYFYFKAHFFISLTFMLIKFLVKTLQCKERLDMWCIMAWAQQSTQPLFT